MPKRVGQLQAGRGCALVKSGAVLVTAHHSFSSEGPDSDKWLKRNAANGNPSGVPAALAASSIAALRDRLPVLSPQQDVDLLSEAGFLNIELFYGAFTFKGWEAC